ncbi:serine/threonine protein kinase [Schlesneria paludicola]|uniref:serine/threonine protein kinase n=1 Tax=Schlesneria paludicola TaxID=360056 RepID=UPI00029A52AD|nr:serine/threonine-protein kinase [Schlesneria paludicola]
MNEPPSHELVRQLSELQLCNSGDLRRARGRVRRLSFDLPAFDSVWIDSLVQLRLLTPYQAKLLEQGRASQLQIGPFVAIDEIGRNELGSTYLAQRLNRRDRCVVKRQEIEHTRFRDAQRQMSTVLERAKGFAHPQLIFPHELVTTDDDRLVVVSRFVPGLPLNELLVRRGRFPAGIVFEIGRQLLDGLAAAQAKSLLHGDIRMSNVRLTDTGLAVLVDGGIRPVIHPELTIHDQLTLEAYDGLAPELIGTGATATARSDMYSLGCLLWQLLTGRPPFTTADPLAKIASHQTRTIDDVRTLAPDTPAILAETIRQLTAPKAEERPRSFADVLQRWGRPSSFSRGKLKQFRRLFDGDVPHFSSSGAGDRVSRPLWIGSFLFAITGAVAMFYDAGLRTELLDVVSHLYSAAQVSRQAATQSTASSQNITADSNADLARNLPHLKPLPAPTPEGVIFLNEHGPYDAPVVKFMKGKLVIRGTLGVKPEIVVRDTPLQLTATSISLEHLVVRHAAPHPMVLVESHCQQLNILNCEFVASPINTSRSQEDFSTANEIGSLKWEPLDKKPRANQIAIKNTNFVGDANALLLMQAPQSLTVVNTLKVGQGAFVAIHAHCRASSLSLDLDHMTLRESGPLLQLSGEFAEKEGAAAIQIDASDSVFHLADEKSGLITVESAKPRTDLNAMAQWKASRSESVVPPSTRLLTTLDPTGNQIRTVDDAADQFEGLMARRIQFVGKKDLSRPRESKTAQLEGPRVESTQLPGIDPSQIGPAKRSTQVRPSQ